MYGKLRSIAILISCVIFIFAMPIKASAETTESYSYRAYGNVVGQDMVRVDVSGVAGSNYITLNYFKVYIRLTEENGRYDNSLGTVTVKINGEVVGQVININNSGRASTWASNNGWTREGNIVGGSSRWYSKTFPINQTITGLNPSTPYRFSSIEGDVPSYYDTGLGAYASGSLTHTVDRTYINAWTYMVSPIMSFSNIKDKSLTINWSHNGNPSNTQYMLERRAVGGSYTGIMSYTSGVTSFNDSGLQADMSYEYRLTARVYHSDYYLSHNHTEAVSGITTTTADPAVAAAQEASSKANAAKQSAELAKQAADIASSNASLAYGMAQQARDNTWDSSEGKSAAQLAKEARDKANQALNVSRVPVIRKVQGLNGATCTTGPSFVLEVITDYDDAVITASCDGPGSPDIYVSGNKITVYNLQAGGAYSVTVTAAIGTATSKGSFTFFKI